MAENPNIVFNKETLFERVWGLDAVGDTTTVTVHVNRLREKIETDNREPRYIETVWGGGISVQNINCKNIEKVLDKTVL